MKPRPYVGITGFKTRFEVEETNRQFSNYLGGLGYGPMFGFIVSSKRLSNKEIGGTVSPAAKDLEGLASLVPQFSMMHYFTENRDGLFEEVIELFGINKMYERGSCRALQINMDWPRVEQVGKIMREFPEMRIVLQIPARAMEGRGLGDIASRASEYNGLASYCLIDPSGGTGVEFDEGCIDVMCFVRAVLPDTRIGIAGGFSPENVYERYLLVARGFGEQFCIDVQGRLRMGRGEESFVDPVKSETYIENTARAIRESCGK